MAQLQIKSTLRKKQNDVWFCKQQKTKRRVMRKLEGVCCLVEVGAE